MIGQLVLALSILVGLHEFGHFAFAKLFKIRVDKFYIFFDFLFPMPNVANFALVKKKIGETEYGIGWFPLGGYVQIHGMIDETQDASALAGPPQPDEFRGKPAWQRLLVMLGGIIMNVLLGIVIFTAMTSYYGETYLPASAVQYGVLPNGLARQVGFRAGDKIVKINGRPFKDFDDIYQPEVLLGDNTYFTVERGSQLTDVKLPADFLDLSSKQTEDSVLLRPRETFAVDRVTPGGNASKAGLLAGDAITTVAGQPVHFFDELQGTLLANKGKTVPVVVQRTGAAEPLTLNIPVDADGRIGFERKSTLNIGTRTYSLVEALPRGAKKAFSIVWVQARAFGKIFTGKASAKNLGGPVEIAQQFGGVWDWQHFWGLAGILSMVLAFMNLLPVPALDGGHVVFLLYEMILRRKPSDAFLEGAQRVGTVLILALMAYVIVIKQVLKFF